MRSMFRRIRKAVAAAVLAEGGVLSTVGVDYDNGQWWLQAVLIPFATGFVTYWTKNEPGTLLRDDEPPPSRSYQ